MAFGDVPVDKVVEGTVKDRLSRFVDALRERRVVPLLGAGVSAGRIALASELISKLKKLIDTQRFDTPIPSDSFARAAEFAIRAKGHDEVCEKLNIKGWADKAPNPAHRYLAMLAVDGFIDEIITTNYDGCFENAWNALGVRGGHLHVITDATELHHRRSAHGTDLRLYKLNGCARKLKDGRAGAESILITDSQLQGFQKGQERRWVRDLLRVTTRSRTLVLSGFSSDEPQVWQVVRLILEELGALSGGGQEPPEASPRLWVALYEDTIPFHLLMALSDEAQLRGREPLKRGGNGKFDNVFSMRDSEAIGLPCGQGLDAGCFWRRVWIEVFCRSLTDPEGAVPRAFVRTVTGRDMRGRPEEAHLLKVWESVVDEALLHSAVFTEPDAWKGEEHHPGSPGITWAGDRYVSIRDEPEYWVGVILLSLVRVEGDELVGTVVEQEPVPGLRRGALLSESASSASVSAVRDAQGGRVRLHVTTDLLSYIRDRDIGSVKDVEAIQSVVQEYMQNPLSRARRLERDGRTARRKKIEVSP